MAVSAFSISGDLLLGDLALKGTPSGDFVLSLGVEAGGIACKYLTCSSIVTSYLEPKAIYLPFLS